MSCKNFNQERSNRVRKGGRCVAGCPRDLWTQLIGHEGQKREIPFN